jgi:HPt (histidine-containing phosphotransfer) domain-containing protein
MNEHFHSSVIPRPSGETGRTSADDASRSAEFPGIDVADALNRLGGDRELLGKIYLEFCEQYRDGAVTLSNLTAVGATHDAMTLAHTIKGVAGNIGAKRIFEAAKTIEADLRAGGEAAGLTDTLRDALAELSPSRTSRRQDEAAAEPDELSGAGTGDTELIGRNLTRLRTLLTARDLDAEECFAGLKALCPDGPLRQPLVQLGVALQALDFEAALGVLAVLERAVMGTTPA